MTKISIYLLREWVQIHSDGGLHPGRLQRRCRKDHRGEGQDIWGGGDRMTITTQKRREGRRREAQEHSQQRNSWV